MKTEMIPDNEAITRMKEIFKKQKDSYARNPMTSASARIEKIQLLKSMMARNGDAFVEAMKEDFSSKPTSEVLGEIFQISDRAKYTCKNIKKWMKPEKRRMNAAQLPGRARIVFQPLGVVGNMVPYNGPLYVSCVPLMMMIAAGNNCMIKMPEGTPNTSLLFEKLISDTFPEENVAVINGGPETGIAFSALPFDHLLFTGSYAIGKKVMAAAAENLTPVTLELGGKSPVIIDKDFPISLAAERVCLGKSLNGGQVCIGVDYVLIPREKEEEFINAFKGVFNRFFPSINDNPDYTGMGTDAQLKRLESFVEDAVKKGATIHPMSDEKITDGTRKFPGVVISGVTEDMTVYKEEIFGPVLLVVPYDSLDEAIEYVNRGERPLALYYFGFKKENQKKVLIETHSGGATVNDVFVHGGINDLPFGGVGYSGMGEYGGREGFLTFSKAKGVVIRPGYRLSYIPSKILYPPYSNGRLEGIMRKFLGL